MNDERSCTPRESTTRNPFWVCLVVFVALAVDGGFRLAKARQQRQQLERARLNQAAAAKQMADTLAQLPKLETKLQAVSADLIHLGRTNPTAAQLIREFNITWTTGKETAQPIATAETNAPARHTTPSQ